MIAFIKNYQLHSIKNKFILLVLFNITDILFTVILLSTGFFKEANVIMVHVLDNQLTSLIVKVIMPAVLLVYLYHRMQTATEHQLRIANYLINGILIAYIGINVCHLFMLSILPVFMLMV